MSENQEKTRPSVELWIRRRNIMLGLVAAVFLGLHHVGDWVGIGHPFPYILEPIVIGTMGWALWAHPGVHRVLFGDGPKIYRHIIAAVIVIFLIGHTIKKNQATFPFVSWTMYGRVKTIDAPCQIYEAELQSGEKVRFNPSHILPALANARVEHMLKHQIQAIRGAKDPAVRAERMDAHTRTLQALARVRDRRWPGDPVKKIAVTWCEIPVKDFKGPESIRKEPLWEIEVPPRG